jgi:1-acyl-sn-glycerol-3-phosphate acyltransferase
MIDRIVRSAVVTGLVVADTLVHAPAAIVVGLALGPTHDAVSWVYRDYAHFALAACGARLLTDGEARLEPGRRYVFVANHQSHLDALAILAALPRHGLRFVAKQELGEIPLFGAALRATGNVFVGRDDTRGDVGRLDEHGAALVKDISVLFFAEGRRSTDGRLRPFKKGAAVFALKSGLPLVPIGVHGAFEILPPGYEVKPPGRVAVSIGTPIETEGRKLEEREALTHALHAAVADRIDVARALAVGRARGRKLRA